MNQPVIGVLPLWDSAKQSYWMLPDYMKSIELAGGIPIILPLTCDREKLKMLSEFCDGFLFTGGPDADPKLYGAKKSRYCGEIIPERDEAEQILLTLLEPQNKPILGICRGLQIFNIFYGGTLYQDLPSEYTTHLNHSQQRPYSIPSHKVTIEANGLLYSLFGQQTFEVNSCHHQGILSLGKGLQCEAISEDGLIEAISIPEKKFFLGVQWHPEFLASTNEKISQKLFEAFIEASSKKIR